MTAPGDDAPEDCADSPKILARASAYRLCFSSRSRFCLARSSSGVCSASPEAASSSSSGWPSERVAMLPAAELEPLLATIGLRLRTFTCGLRSVVTEGTRSFAWM